MTRRLIEETSDRARPVLVRPDVLDSLTPRGRVVLCLVAKGLSNSEIAERLVVAEQAVVAAYESGLVIPGE